MLAIAIPFPMDAATQPIYEPRMKNSLFWSHMISNASIPIDKMCYYIEFSALQLRYCKEITNNKQQSIQKFHNCIAPDNATYSSRSAIRIQLIAKTLTQQSARTLIEWRTQSQHKNAAWMIIIVIVRNKCYLHFTTKRISMTSVSSQYRAGWLTAW